MNSFFKTFLSRVFLLVVFSAQMVLANETFFRSEDFISEDKVYDKFSSEIKPILDKRCVVCHSCSESPCQLKLESIEGLERGAKKESVRGSLLFRNSGNRLFFDASSVGEWRKKNFYSVIEPIDYNGEPVPSVMLRALVEGHTNLEDSPPSKKTQRLGCKGNAI